jgi:hypothetical protein
MGIYTIDFIIGKYSYLITEDTTRKYVSSLTVEAFGEDGSHLVKEPIRAIGKTALEATIKAYEKLIETTVCTSKQQLEFVMKIGEICMNYKQILEENPA